MIGVQIERLRSTSGRLVNAGTLVLDAAPFSDPFTSDNGSVSALITSLSAGGVRAPRSLAWSASVAASMEFDPSASRGEFTLLLASLPERILSRKVNDM